MDQSSRTAPVGVWHTEKRSAFDRANKLLASGDDEALRYACLELRLTLEAIAYAKLKVYAKRIPVSVLETWQPPQAMRALKEFEPHADQNFTMQISPASSPGVPKGEWHLLGEHKAVRVSRLRKLYNKLGNHLHLPAGKKRSESAVDALESAHKLRADLEAISRELAPVVATDFDASFAHVLTFDCLACGRPSVVNAAGAEKSGIAVCLQEDCQAQHQVLAEGDVYKFTRVVTEFDCLVCKEKIPLENGLLEVGLRFNCPHCKTAHQIAERHWLYGTLAPISDELIDSDTRTSGTHGNS